MRLAKVNMALSVLVTVLFLGFNVMPSPPSLRNRIPSNLPPKSRPKWKAYIPGGGQAGPSRQQLGKHGREGCSSYPLVIGMLGDSAGIELKTDPDSKISENTSPGIEAAVALGKIGDPALDPLIGALKDKNPHVRILAAVALEELENPKAVEALIAALKDEDFDVQSSAARALGQ